MKQLVIIGGPNGAGKSSLAAKILPNFFTNYDFVNADTIAKGLSAFNSSSTDMLAGRILLNRIKELRDAGKTFSFESTLASRSFVPFIKSCKAHGYEITLLYIWVNSPCLAIDRVNNRKIEGGHFLPEDVIIRRYERSRENFLTIYLPLADEWHIYDNSGKDLSRIANSKANTIEDAKTFLKMGISGYKLEEPKMNYDVDELDRIAKAAIREELDRRHKLNLPIVFMHEGKIITIEGKDLYNYLDKEERKE